MPGCSQQEAEEQLSRSVILFEVSLGKPIEMHYGKKNSVRGREFRKKNLLRDKVREEKSPSEKSQFCGASDYFVLIQATEMFDPL